MTTAGALLPAAVNATAAHAAAPARLPAVVSLGDSIASGEGGRLNGNPLYVGPGWYNDEPYADRGIDIYGSTWNFTDPDGGQHPKGCHRSDSAPVFGLETTLKVINIACSGAGTVNIRRAGADREGGQAFKFEPPQADRLRELAETYDVKAITLTVGANDLDWAGVVTECVWEFMWSGKDNEKTCHAEQEQVTRGRIWDIRTKLSTTIDSVVKSMDEAHYAAGSYRIIVQGYIAYIAGSSELIAWDKRTAVPGDINHPARGCPINTIDANWFNNTLVPRLNGALYSVVRDRRQNGVNIQFLDRHSAFKGHELCNKYTTPVHGAPVGMAEAEWANKLRDPLPFATEENRFAESLHPNHYGQLALQQCLAKAYATTGDQRCTGNGFGSTGVTVSPLPATWVAASPSQTLLPAGEIPAGTCVNATNGKAHLCFQAGRLYAYDQYWNARWNSGYGGANTRAFMCEGGNLAILNTSTWQAAWSSPTFGNPSAQLVVGNDGQIVIYNMAGKVLWKVPGMSGPIPPEADPDL